MRCPALWPALAGLFLLVPVTVLGQVSIKPSSDKRFPPAQIAASPARVTVEIGERPVGGAIRVFNLGADPVRVKAAPFNFDLDENNEVRVIPPTAQSLDQWLVYNPAVFTIAPGKQQVVRFSIRPRSRPAPGEHRAMLFFEQDRDKTGSAGTVQVNFRLGVAIYGMAAPSEATGTLHRVAVAQRSGELRMSFDVQATGNAHVRLSGQFSLWPADEFPGLGKVAQFNLSKAGWSAPAAVRHAGRLPSVPILPGTRRKVVISIPRPEAAGNYRLAIKGSLGETAIDRVISLTVN